MSTRTVAIVVVALSLSGASARASVTIDIEQVGPDVVATGAGTLNITALTANGVALQHAVIIPSGAAIFMSAGNISFYAGISGPSAFGSVGSVLPTTTSGDAFAIAGFTPELTVPSGYVSGTHLSATDTFTNSSFLSLGLTPGKYTWTWGTGPSADALTVQIGPTAAVVPEPSTAIGAAFGAVAFIAYGWSRQRRAQRRQAAA
jgi:hypothetical protein